MPRTLSQAARAAAFAQSTDQCFLALLTLSHPTLPQPIRVCNDGRDLVSRGLTFQRFPFEFELPEESDAAPPTVRLRICNVDRTVVAALRTAASSGEPVQVRLEIVLASSPDTIETGPFDFALREASYDAIVVEGTLVYEDLLNEPFPADTFTPTTYPGLFT